MKFVEKELPKSIREALGVRARHFKVQASAGQGGWTHAPWIVLLDLAITTSVEEGFYVVYLLSKGGIGMGPLDAIGRLLSRD